ncbi:copper chaperone PCu(A)C [Shewanella submarina]|uniref:Copper chaperone PCu(A)C n=1 Tax=Shewanella submarina TaxID=2016376 RepID=A0ABV7G8W8_9GAMM|nr:copper chaperone PCu(A)C [Shewanella submarina]MCL1038624.1 copper chaperone PCu(A)C [Shewanella submarina]
MEFMTLKLIFKQLFGAILACFSAFSLAQEVQVDDGFVRAMPPTVPNSAAYMTLKNPGKAKVLVGVRTQAAQEAQLHTLIEEQGMVKMRQVSEFSLPAEGELVLAPSGDHIMLLGLTQPLKEGEEVGLTLIFADESEQLISLPVRKGASQNHHHHHHH